MERGSSRRPGRWRAILIVGILAGATLLWWRHRSADEAVAAAPALEDRAATAAISQHRALAKFPRLARMVSEAERSDRVGLHMLEDPTLSVVIADHLIASRFPNHSRPLEPSQVDLLEPNRRYETPDALMHEDRSRVDTHERVLFTGDKFRLHGAEAMHVWFERLREGERVAVPVKSARAYAVDILTREPLGVEVPLAMTPDPSYVWTGAFSTAGTPLADHVGYVNLEVRYDYGGDRPGVATIEVYVQPTANEPGRFTGEFREAIEDGSLVVYAGVEIYEPGFFIVDANFFDANQQPTASARFKQELAAGRHEVPLTLYGRIVHEKQAPSPFTLTNLRGARFMLGEDPDRMHMADAAHEHRTGSYDLDAFTGAEYWDEDKERHVRTLVDHAAEGKKGLLGTSLEDAADGNWRPRL